MGSCTENKLFKIFVLVVFLSHCIQIVWNQPISDKSTAMDNISPLSQVQLTTTPYSIIDSDEITSTPSSSELSTTEDVRSLDPQDMAKQNVDKNLSETELSSSEESEPIKLTYTPNQIYLLCSMFKAFFNIDNAKDFKCNLVSSNISPTTTEERNVNKDSENSDNYNDQSLSEDEKNAISNKNLEILNTNDLSELETSDSTNNFVKRSNSRIDILGETFDGYSDFGNEEESITRRIPLNLLHGHGHGGKSQYGPPTSSSYVPYGHNTKLLQNKSTINLPVENGCPHGQRRDYSGYCRTILRFRRPVFNPAQYIINPVNVRPPPPVGYYYKKYITVPTYHFILP